jgi:hypothetical protein
MKGIWVRGAKRFFSDGGERGRGRRARAVVVIRVLNAAQTTAKHVEEAKLCVVVAQHAFAECAAVIFLG